MKEVVIITDRARIAKIIQKDLVTVFKDNIATRILTLKEAGELSEIKGDLFLFTLGNRIAQVKEKISNPDNIMVVTRTFKEKEFVKILEIPKNTKVLVVNDNYENTLQTVALLYDLNVNNIIMSPYKENEYDTTIKLALTPGEADKVPPGISKIIDLGDRCLDLATFLEIIYRLQISNTEISARLLNYSAQLINSDEGITKNYKETVMRNIQLERVLDMTEHGVAMTLKEGEIVLCNQKFRNMVGTDVIEGETNIYEILDEEIVLAMKSKIPENQLVKINGRDIVLTKKEIVYQRDIYQNVYFFKDITYIKSLEQTISGQLNSKGFVAKYTLGDFVYSSQAMEKCLESARIFSNTEKTILILGQSGTGKELLAQSIHNMSERHLQPFVAINCAAVPAGLLESELFGYEKGAFTGASKDGKAGLFEYANNGTIFLDEIGDMPYELQSRLLRVIQEKQIMRIGSDKVKEVNVRIISATNKDLQKEVENSSFREDLFYRISVLPIRIPPLCERKEDILPIFQSFLPPNLVIREKEKKLLLEYNWPGNVRELRNAAEFYELMYDFEECLPHSILKAQEIKPSKIEDILLSEIKLAFESGKTLGRQRLNAILEEKYKVVISEYKLRAILNSMKEGGLIEINKGRGGIVPKND